MSAENTEEYYEYRQESKYCEY